MKNQPLLFWKFVRNPLIFIGLSSIFQPLSGQMLTGFRPANFENRLLKIPDCGEQLPGEIFSIEAVILPENYGGSRPILTKGKFNSAWFSAFLLNDGRLTWEFFSIEKPNPESVEYTSRRHVYSTREKVFFSGEPTRVGFVHRPDGVQFFVNRKLVPGFWADKTAPARASLGLETWKIGSTEVAFNDAGPTFFNGAILGVACWNDDQSTIWKNFSNPASLSEKSEKLVFAFDLSQIGPDFGQTSSESLPNFAGGGYSCWTAWLPLKDPPNAESQSDSGTVYPQKKARDWPGLIAILVVIVLSVLFVWLNGQLNSSPVSTRLADGKLAKILHEDLPAELAGLSKNEEIDFIIRSRLPLPFWKIAKIAGYAAGAIFLTRGWWFEIFELVLGPDELFSPPDLLPKLLPIGASAVVVWLLTREEWMSLLHSASNRSVFVGTSLRLLQINSQAGDFRPIFWEQVRGVKKFGNGKTLELELRTGLTSDDENYFSEKIWLTGIESGPEVAELIKKRLAENPIDNRAEDFILFGKRENFQYRLEVFGELEVFRKTVFVRKSPFQERPFLMLRSRIGSLEIEPYDLPEPGWLLFSRAENGHRQPFFFSINLGQIQLARAFLNQVT